MPRLRTLNATGSPSTNRFLGFERKPSKITLSVGARAWRVDLHAGLLIRGERHRRNLNQSGFHPRSDSSGQARPSRSRYRPTSAPRTSQQAVCTL